VCVCVVSVGRVGAEGFAFSPTRVLTRLYARGAATDRPTDGDDESAQGASVRFPQCSDGCVLAGVACRHRHRRRRRRRVII